MLTKMRSQRTQFFRKNSFFRTISKTGTAKTAAYLLDS